MKVNDHDPIDETCLPADRRLLDYLRDDCGLLGTKEACGRGECGACTVLVDGKAVLSCITYAARITGHVETIEGIAEESHPLREAFARHGAFQCGFCTPGQIVRATAVLRDGCPATDPELRAAMSGNVCRCTGYNGIIAAIREVAG